MRTTDSLEIAPAISVVIVNFNAGSQLPRCLDSLRAGTWRDYEVIVVDNASTDSSTAYLDAYPEVRKVHNSTNKGFASGQNQGIALARGKYVVALNFDLVMSPPFLEQLVRSVESRPEIGWGCGKLLTMSSTGEHTDIIYAAGHLLPNNRFPLLRGNGEIDQGQYDRCEQVFGAPGAAAIYKKDLIKDLCFHCQFFDESFFTWCEDVDVDWRAQNRGWKCLYVPEAIAYHQGHIGEEYREPFRSFRAKTTIQNRWLMILANQRIHDLDLISLASYELSLFTYVVRARLLRVYFDAIAATLSLLPAAWQKRNLVFKRN